MEDEVSKHTKKIYRAIKDPRRSFAEKTKEIVIEVLIIVFAVTLSIWFHSWSEHRHEQKEVQGFLKGLKEDLTKDKSLLQENKNQIVQLDSNFKFLIVLDGNGHSDTIGEAAINDHLYFSLPVTHPNIGRYEGFKSSGKIGEIENDSLKENILRFYEQYIPDLSYSENFVNTLQTKMLDLRVNKSESMTSRDFVTTSKMKSLFNIGIHNFEVSSDLYDKAMAQADRIIAAIDKELE